MPDETITHVAVEMTAKTSPSPVPKPAPLPAMHVAPPLSRMTMQTHVILSPDASGPFLRSRASAGTRVYVRTEQKSVSHLYRLAPHRSEVYLAVD